MTRTALYFLLASLFMSGRTHAADEKIKATTFDEIRQKRVNFNEKVIEIEGKVKDIKSSREGRNKYSLFFLMDAKNPETSVSVRVLLSKKKNVINSFACNNGDFTVIRGLFKAWGKASYLGSVETLEPIEIKCSDKVQVQEVLAPPVPVVKEIIPEKTPEPAKQVVLPKPIILKISEGASEITDRQGKKITKVGTSLDPGSVIKTGATSNVQLKYPDGSKVSVGADSKLVTGSGTENFDTVFLKYGRIHALILKNTRESLHFKVKTRNATMGVRGTQFFVEADHEDLTSTRVIKGRVDVAKDDRTLELGKGEPIYHDEMIEVKKGKLSETKPFSGAEYLVALRNNEPDLINFADKVEDKKSAPQSKKSQSKIQEQHVQKAE